MNTPTFEEIDLKAAFKAEAFGQGYWVIRPTYGNISRNEHSALYSEFIPACMARDTGNFEIRHWGEELPPVVGL